MKGLSFGEKIKKERIQALKLHYILIRFSQHKNREINSSFAKQTNLGKLAYSNVQLNPVQSLIISLVDIYDRTPKPLNWRFCCNYQDQLLHFILMKSKSSSWIDIFSHFFRLAALEVVTWKWKMPYFQNIFDRICCFTFFVYISKSITWIKNDKFKIYLLFLRTDLQFSEYLSHQT